MRKFGNVALCLVRNAWISGFRLATSRLAEANSALPRYLVASATNLGKFLRHGSQKVPQQSTATSLPLLAATCWAKPSRLTSRNVGAGASPAQHAAARASAAASTVRG